MYSGYIGIKPSTNLGSYPTVLHNILVDQLLTPDIYHMHLIGLVETLVIATAYQMYLIINTILAMVIVATHISLCCKLSYFLS